MYELARVFVRNRQQLVVVVLLDLNHLLLVVLVAILVDLHLVLHFWHLLHRLKLVLVVLNDYLVLLEIELLQAHLLLRHLGLVQVV